MTETGPEQIIAPTGIPPAEAFGTPSVDIRHSIALQHLWNARHAARVATEGEATKDRTNFRAVRGHSMNAVISAAAFIEAIVNEVFANVADWQPGRSGREGLADEQSIPFVDCGMDPRVSRESGCLRSTRWR